MLVVVGGGGMLSRLTGVGGALSERGLDIPEGKKTQKHTQTKQNVKQDKVN